MSKFKFTPVSTGMLVACLILLPIVISVLSSGYKAMRYYRSYSHALNAYNAGEMVEALDALEKASKAHPEKVYPKLLEAKILMEQGKLPGANSIYKETQEDSWVAKLGSVICDFHELAKKKNVKEELYWELEKRLKNIIQEAEGNPDPLICRAHLYLKVAQTYLKKDHEKFLRYLTSAKKDLKKVHKNIKESPPSRTSCHSLYIAQGMVHYLQAKVNLNGKIRPDSEEAKKTARDLHEAILNFRSAYLYRFNTSSVLHNINNLYIALLGAPWLDKDFSKKMRKNAQEHISERGKFSSYIRFLGRTEKLKQWSLEKHPGDIYASMMVSYYHAGDLKNAFQLFSLGSTNVANPTTGFFNRLEIDTCRLASTGPPNRLSNSIRSWGDHNFKETKKKKNWLKSQMSREDFIYVNNYAGSHYFDRTRDLNPHIEVLNKSFAFLPGNTVRFERHGKKSVTARRIVSNNLYYLYKRMKNVTEAKKREKFRLR